MVRAGLLSAAMTVASAAPAAAAPRRPKLAVRVGWAYGVGGELELRPGAWGIGISGGYVPGYGLGGYLGVQWGQRALDQRGFVAEAGAWRGVHNPLRVADTGLGTYAMAGYTVPLGGLSLRVVAGGGLPLTDDEHLGSFEVLAKVTIGFTW